jgi:hypothetical protein
VRCPGKEIPAEKNSRGAFLGNQGEQLFITINVPV